VIALDVSSVGCGEQIECVVRRDSTGAYSLRKATLT
jgi:hypothetical protein